MANENMDMKRMQQDAIHRVQEMQNRANQQLRGTPPLSTPQRGNRPNNGPPFPADNQGRNHKEPQNTHHGSHEQGGPVHGQGESPMQQHHEPPAEPQNLVGNLIDGVMKDSERTLIMILLLLLFNEKADTSVIFSLLYLLL